MSDWERIPSIPNDLPTARDALGFEPYADALADIIVDPNTQTPLTLGIFGTWGSGKTSLMLQIRAKVAGGETQAATPTHRTIWFNAWKYNQEDALWRALLLALLDDLEDLLKDDPPRPAEKEREAAQKVELLRQALYREATWTEKGELRADWMQALTAGAGLAFNVILSGVGLGLAQEAVKAAQEELGKGKPVSQLSKLAQAFRREELVHYQAQLRSLEQFQENFSALVNILLQRDGEKPRRLVIFVDDLDRCVPEKAVQVLEAIKLFLDVPGAVFVLGLDAEAIERAVQTRYRGEVKAREYLEKIIQLQFMLPPIEEGPMRQYVKSLAPALPDPRCEEVFAVGLTANPRQVKRTLSTFLLLMRLVQRQPALAETIKPVLLAKMVAIQSAEPEFYRLLREGRAGYLRDLERFFREQQAAREGKKTERELPSLPEALQPFQGRDSLQRLLCLCDDEEARFETLTPEEIRVYLTLARRSVIVEASTARARADALGPFIHVAKAAFEPEMVVVPAGPFLMGTSDEQIADMVRRFDWAKEAKKQGWFDDEKPLHEVNLPEFAIGRYPVTNAEYAAFVQATGYQAPTHWREGRVPEGLVDHPVVNVSWHDALAYANWLKEKTDKPYSLPSEAEWEKAARGRDARLWPWGNDWDPSRANCAPDGPGRTTPVDQYSPQGDSPYGCADMAGNVWEWTRSIYKAYPYDPADPAREDLSSGSGRVLRGGSFYDAAGNARCACRDGNYPFLFSRLIGFRVVLSPVGL